MRIAPDDSAYAVDGVWLGPDTGDKAVTLPWTARYQAYAIWLGLFSLILLVEALTPLKFHTPPVWEICLTTLATYGVTGFIDHERPLVAVVQTFFADLRAPREQKDRTVVVRERIVIVRTNALGQRYLWRMR